MHNGRHTGALASNKTESPFVVVVGGGDGGVVAAAKIRSSIVCAFVCVLRFSRGRFIYINVHRKTLQNTNVSIVQRSGITC